MTEAGVYLACRIRFVLFNIVRYHEDELTLKQSSISSLFSSHKKKWVVHLPVQSEVRRLAHITCVMQCSSAYSLISQHFVNTENISEHNWAIYKFASLVSHSFFIHSWWQLSLSRMAGGPLSERILSHNAAPYTRVWKATATAGLYLWNGIPIHNIISHIYCVCSFSSFMCSKRWVCLTCKTILRNFLDYFWLS